MEIKQLDVNFAGEYMNLRLEALRENPEAFSSSYEEESQGSIKKYEQRLQQETSYTFGAIDNGDLVGIVVLVTEPHKKLGHKAEIVSMYVTPRHRRSGIGRLLMTEAINKAKTLGSIEQVNLTVNAGNLAAKKLYSSLGFKPFGKEIRAIKIGKTYYDEEYMVLFL